MPPTPTLLSRGLPLLTTTLHNPHAPVAKWLLSTSAVVATIVHVGGITRLTKSGLSMTDWKPLGSLPPLTDDEWRLEFERYRSFPEWDQRRSMTLDEFQTIYYWEWGHRMLGRVAGVCFAAPFAYFTLRKRIPHGYAPKFLGLLALGGGQGLVGWWMVRSGLGDDRRGDKTEIRVSPYRLATHLGVAFATFGLLQRCGWDVLTLPHEGAEGRMVRLTRSLGGVGLGLARRLRMGAVGVSGLTFVTAVSGAFVAGNDAGRAYNTFPKMDGRWVPEDIWDESLVPSYRNLFENTATIQFDHRVLGSLTALSAVSLATVGLCHPASRLAVTPQVVRGLQLVGGVATVQVSLGVATLLSYVPLELAALHQLGSLALLGSGVYLVQAMRYVSPRVLRMAMMAGQRQQHGKGMVKTGLELVK